MKKKEKNSKNTKFTIAIGIVLVAVYILVQKAQIGFFEI